MIINTGSRTDIVQYYTPWLLNRFKEGYVYSRNPYNTNQVLRYELNPEVVDCVIFCSKNYEPILDKINFITDRFNTYFNYTITAYGKDIEPNVPDIDKSIDTLIQLSKLVGKKRIAWRYDPVLLTKKYTKELHYETFNYMAERLHPYIDRCIFSFVDMYKKLEKNMREIILLNEKDKDEVAYNIGFIAKKYNLIVQTCAQSENYEKYGINISGCITAEILEKANNIKFDKVIKSKNRPCCNCIENRNIGDYNTCPNGCKYCYANQNPKIALENYKLHNPASAFILGELKENDVILRAKQTSYLLKFEQKKLF